jgi:hypothetical protein
MLIATPALSPETRRGRQAASRRTNAMYRITDEPLFRIVLGLIGTMLSAGITLGILNSSPVL